MSRRTSSALLATCTAVAVAAISAPADAAAAAPSITSLSVTAGPAAGGTRVNVAGSNFAKGATVRFGTSVYGTSVNVTSSKSLWVTAPAHAPATADVRVHTAAGWSPITTKDRYTWEAAAVPPAVSALAPDAGPTAGGTSVAITGTGFTATSKVAFGDAAGTAVRYVSPTRLTAVSPDHPEGTVHVTVSNGSSTSETNSGDMFTYSSASAPEPVTALTVSDVTTTTVTLRWTASTSSGVDGVVVRRAAGSTAPATVADGQSVADVPKGRNGVLDLGLTKDSAYAYAVFAYKSGPLYSEPTAVNVTTVHNSRPDVPTNLTTSPATRGAGSCAIRPYGAVGRLGGGSLSLSARTGDPDPNDRVTAQFRLWDLGPNGTAAGDPIVTGTAGPYFGVTTARYSVAESNVVDGHVYKWDVVASDDGSLTSASNPCYFLADSDAPTAPVITSSDSSYQVGTPAHFHFASSETLPAAGTPSGFDHFEYSFASSAGPYTSVPGVVSVNDATADLAYTPTSFGTHYLSVRAVDKAGNVSTTATFQFYVRS